jgi:hypothetical protein
MDCLISATFANLTYLLIQITHSQMLQILPIQLKTLAILEAASQPSQQHQLLILVLSLGQKSLNKLLFYALTVSTAGNGNC